MKTTMLATSLFVLLAACGNDGTGATAQAPEAVQPAPAPGAGAGGETRASATGTIDSIDAANHRIVISHGPVAALGWPAMTMGFVATPGQIGSVQPGQRVAFEFVVRGAESTLTRIDPAR